MANAVRYYAPIDTHRAVPSVTTGFDANHPVHNCLDFSLDSYALPSAADHQIVIDRDPNYGTFNTSGYTYVAIFIVNELELRIEGLLNVQLETAADAAFTTPTDYGSQVAGATNLPLIFWHFTPQDYNRYIRLTFTLSSLLAQTAMVTWGFYYDFQYQHEWETVQAVKAINAVDDMGAGRIIIRNFRQMQPQVYTRHYRCLSDSDIQKLKNLFSMSHGRWMPWLMRDNPDFEDDGSCKVIRHLSDEFQWTPIQYDLNDVTLRFEQVPYLRYNYEW